jgi:hypothetical protein
LVKYEEEEKEGISHLLPTACGVKQQPFIWLGFCRLEMETRLKQLVLLGSLGFLCLLWAAACHLVACCVSRGCLAISKDDKGTSSSSWTAVSIRVALRGRVQGPRLGAGTGPLLQYSLSQSKSQTRLGSRYREIHHRLKE